MASNATEHDIRRLPLYRLGFNDGQDLGLRQALDAITAERRSLEDDIIVGTVTDPSNPTYAFADGRLESVAKRIGALFRAGAS